MITTDSFTRCWRKGWINAALRLFCVCVCVLWMGVANAQNPADISQLRVERVDDEVVASGSIAFDLPTAVEDALIKGIPLFFVLEADLLRERWYWFDRTITSAKRHTRLIYLPLTRRWRLNVSAGEGREAGVGLALNQSYDTLEQALSAFKRVSHWPIANADELIPGVKYKVDLRFRLDLGQLPLPFQIGALGQSEWDLAATVTVPLTVSTTK